MLCRIGTTEAPFSDKEYSTREGKLSPISGRNVPENVAEKERK